MWKIKNMQIEELWNEKTFNITFNTDINILIGSNGIGKTTILKLLNSALTYDVDFLQSVEFKVIKISMINDESKIKTLRIEKNENIDFYISGKLIIKHESNKFDGLYSWSENKTRKVLENNVNRFRKALEIPVIRWLPSSRIAPQDKNIKKETGTFEKIFITTNAIKESEEYDDPLDHKLSILLKEVNKKIINTNSNIQTEDEIFRTSLFKTNFRNLDAAFEGLDQFSNTMSYLNKPKKVEKLIKDIDDLREAYKIDISTTKKFSSEEVVILRENMNKKNISGSDIQKITALSFWVEAIKLYDEYKNKISIARESLLHLEKSFDAIFGEKFTISTLSELRIYKLQNSITSFSPFHFSSGEKQMFIFIMETTLYLLKECIYLTDEPEISLHLKWQKEYLSTLISTNKHNQYFIATHSPDIVGKFGNKIINLNTQGE